MIKLWVGKEEEALNKRICSLTMKAHEKAVTAGCWLGAMTLVTGSEDSSIMLWDVVKRSGNTYRYEEYLNCVGQKFSYSLFRQLTFLRLSPHTTLFLEKSCKNKRPWKNKSLHMHD